jgi:hypothetical protein
MLYRVYASVCWRGSLYVHVLCMYMLVCSCICMYIAYIRRDACIYNPTRRQYICVCMCLYLLVSYILVYICIYVFMYVLVCMCIYVSVSLIIGP